MTAYPDVEVHFVSLPSSEIEERSARLRELLLRGVLRFVHSQTDRERRIDELEVAFKTADLENK